MFHLCEDLIKTVLSALVYFVILVLQSHVYFILQFFLSQLDLPLQLIQFIPDVSVRLEINYVSLIVDDRSLLDALHHYFVVPQQFKIPFLLR